MRCYNTKQCHGFNETETVEHVIARRTQTQFLETHSTSKKYNNRQTTETNKRNKTFRINSTTSQST